MRVIKKCSNRKLYDKCYKRYITLEELPTILSETPSISVIDKDTGMDITQITLLKALNPASFTYDELVAKLTETA